jgi:hypothetical protein
MSTTLNTRAYRSVVDRPRLASAPAGPLNDVASGRGVAVDLHGARRELIARPGTSSGGTSSTTYQRLAAHGLPLRAVSHQVVGSVGLKVAAAADLAAPELWGRRQDPAPAMRGRGSRGVGARRLRGLAERGLSWA